MKMIVFFMLILMSLSLYSQQDIYWKKVDFDFGSGVKLINIYQYPNYYRTFDHSFLVATENNQIFFFKDIYTKPLILNLPEDSIEIQKIRLVGDKLEPTIFILADQTLFFSSDFGISWDNINDINYISGIIDFEIRKNYFYSNDIVAVNSDSVLLRSTNLGDTWTNDTNFFKIEKGKMLSSEEDEISCLTNTNKLFVQYYDLSTAYKWSYAKTFDKETQFLEIRYVLNDYFYINSELNLYSHKDSARLINSSSEYKVTCMTETNWTWLTAFKYQEDLPQLDGIIFGTDGKGAYFYDPYSNYFVKFGYGLDNLKSLLKKCLQYFAI